MKSREKYCKEYDLFVRWMEGKHVKSINECFILAYFEDPAKTYSSINRSSNKVGHRKQENSYIVASIVNQGFSPLQQLN